MADYIITRMSSDELKHYGIKGQKWGVRRFENADGTLTAEGRARYQKDSLAAEKAKRDQNTASGKKKAESDIQKIESLSDGPEKDKAVNQMLSKLKSIENERDSLANKAYNEALYNRKVNPRWAFNQARNKYDSTENGGYYDKISSWLFEEIEKKSGNWYENEGVSDGFKKNRNALERCQDAYKKREKELGIDQIGGSIFAINRRDKIRKNDKILNELMEKSKKIDNDLIGVVLKDLRFQDTPENRELLYPYVFWD